MADYAARFSFLYSERQAAGVQWMSLIDPPFTWIPDKMATPRLDFSILVYPEDSFWIAHCLEMDLPAEGKTPQEALRNLVDISNVQISSAIEEGNLDSIFSPSPPGLWRLYALAKDMQIARIPRRIKSINRLAVRELVPA